VLPDELRCLSGLSAYDRSLLDRLQKDIAEISGLRTNPKLYETRVREIVAPYLGEGEEPGLSPRGQAAAVAMIRKGEIETFVANMSQAAENEDFRAAYDEYNRAAEHYQKNRQRFAGGLWEAEADTRRLQAALDRLLGARGRSEEGALAKTSLGADEKKQLRQSFLSAAQSIYMAGAERFAQTQATAKFFGRPEVAVGAAALVVALPVGAYVAATSAPLIATSAWGAASLHAAMTGAGAGVSFAAGVNLARVGSRVALDGNNGEDVFCALGKEVQKSGPQAIQEVLVAGALGGALGGGLVLAPALVPAVAPAMPAVTSTLAVSGLGLGAFATWQGGAQAQNLFHEAWLAANEGESERARELLVEAQKKAADAGIDGVSTVLGGVLLAKNAAQLRTALAESWKSLGGGKTPTPVRAPESPQVDSFRRRYSMRSPSQENQDWIRIAESTSEAAPDGKVFYSFEQSILKHLNDKALREKQLPTALVGYWRDRFRLRLSEEPEAASFVKSRYADYKSDRLVVDKDASPEQIQKAYDLANQDLDEMVKQLGLPFAAPTRSPLTWHLGGSGATADEAAVAARMARRQAQATAANPASLKVQKFSDWVPELNNTFRRVSTLRQKLASSDARVWRIVKDADGGVEYKVPTPHVIDIVRKETGQSDEALQKILGARLGAKLGVDEVRSLRQYVSEVENLVPDVRIAERVHIPVEDAKFGIVSYDFKGQNSRNIFETAVALAKNENASASQVIKATREGERIATRALDQAKAEVAKLGDEIYFSGDDGMAFPKRPLTLGDKFQRLQKIQAMEGEVGKRVVFVAQVNSEGRKLPPNELRALIETGEHFEKDLYSAIALKWGDARAEKLHLGIDMLPSGKLNNDQVNVLVPSTLSRADEAALLQILKRVGLQHGFRDSRLVLAP
jgi:hypothetical protein